MGAALTFTIVTEGVVSVALLIPSTYNWIKDRGKAEGLKEGEVTGRKAGRKEERQAQRKRLKEAYRRFGKEVDGKVTLTITPEVEAFLNSEDPDEE